MLVVIGHLTDSNIQSFIYLFHMPLFFFLSGLLYHDSDKFVKKRITQLIIPFFAFSIISIPIKYIERCILQRAFYINIFYLSPQFYNIPLWFCISLFTISCIFWGLKKYCKDIRIMLTFSILISFCGLALSYCKIFLPLYLSQSLLAFPYYAIGFYSNSVIKINWKGTIIAILILIYAQFSHISTNISGLIVNANPLLFYIPALSGIYIIIHASMLRGGNRYRAFLLIFIFLGRNSLYIFALHWPFITILQKFNEVIGIDKHIGNIFIFFTIIILSLCIGTLLAYLFPKYFRPISLKEKSTNSGIKHPKRV